MKKIPTDILAEYEDDIDLTGLNNFNSSFTKECFQSASDSKLIRDKPLMRL